MLQPRIPIRPLRQTCARFLWLLAYRQYTSLAEMTTSEPPYAPVDQINVDIEPPPMRDETMAGQSALRRYKPRTPGVRHLVRPVNDHLYKGRPIFQLTFPKKGQSLGGRNHTGHVTVRHRGGGHKRRIRVVDFDRFASGEHYVERIEHDPGRSAHIALVKNKKTGAMSYIVAAEGLRAGDTVQSYRSGIPEDLLKSMGGSIDQGVLAAKTAWRGNCLPLGMIPVGTPIFNISLAKDGKAMYCRSAGTHAFIIGKGEDAVQKELVRKLEDKRARDEKKATEKAEEERVARLAETQSNQTKAKAAAERGIAPDAEKENNLADLLSEPTPPPATATATANSARKQQKDLPTRPPLQPTQLPFSSPPSPLNQPPDPNPDSPSSSSSSSSTLTLSDDDLLKLEKASQYVTVRLSSGEIRLIDKEAVATIGVASNGNHQFRQLGKAGRSRWLGIRPTVRGLAMNANEHPHGGGRGKGKGNRDPVSPWGMPAKSGYKTRSKQKVDKLIVQQRPRNQGKRRRGYN